MAPGYVDPTYVPDSRLPRYGAKLAQEPRRRNARRGADILPKSRLHQVLLAVAGAPFAIIAVPVIAVCNIVLLLAFRAKRKASSGNVSFEAGSSTAHAVLQGRAMYNRFGFGPDYLAPLLVSRRSVFPNRLAHAAFVVGQTVVELYFKAFRVDLFCVLYRAVMADGMVPPSDIGTSLQIRTCWIDDAVETFLGESDGPSNAKQVVVLGAGFDTRCYRFSQSTDACAVVDGAAMTVRTRRENVTWFEVDSDASQKFKRMALAGAKVDASHVRFVQADFSVPNAWIEALVRVGLDRTVQTLFIWEGVVMYLPREAVEQTLRDIRTNFASGSKIAFSYITLEYTSHRKSNAVVKAAGEPWLFALPAPALLPLREVDSHVRKLVEDQGLVLIEHFWDLDEAKSYYLPSQQNGNLVGFAWRETSGGLCLAGVR